MKKIIAFLLAASLVALCACSAPSTEETTAEAETASNTEAVTVEETTRRIPTVYEMSPENADVSLPLQIEKNTSQLAFSSFTEISLEKSYLNKADKCDKILKSENGEYYFIGEENKILVVLFDENGEPEYSACYNSESGALEFLGDDMKTWYFNEDGSLNCMVYEYNDDSGYSGVYTFYTPDGIRDLVRVGSSYYDAELFEVEEADLIKCMQKYSHTMEIVSQ